MGSRRNAREWALQFLFQSEYNKAPTLEASLALFWEELERLAKAPDAEDLPRTAAPQLAKAPEDFRKSRAYATKLVNGVFEHLNELDKAIDEASEHWDLARMGTVERNILRIGAYEILFEKGDRGRPFPGSVAINEAVTLAKVFSSSQSSKFVNGILDRILRGRDGDKGAKAAPAATPDKA
jgi:N utilization substance protein B